MLQDKNWVVAPPVTPKGCSGGQPQKSINQNITRALDFMVNL
jgi:hypothetical protein